MLDKQGDIEMVCRSLVEITTTTNVDLILLSNDQNRSCNDVLTDLKLLRPDLRVIVVGNDTSDKSILNALTYGARGYLSESAAAEEFAHAISLVHEGSIWAPRRVLASLVDKIHTRRIGAKSPSRNTLTSREKQVLEMLVAGCSNKEISAPLGIEVRTVKAHIAKMMRKVGVENRVALSVHALTHSLIRQ